MKMYREELRQVRVKGKSAFGVHLRPNIQFLVSSGECIVTIRQNKLFSSKQELIATN